MRIGKNENKKKISETKLPPTPPLYIYHLYVKLNSCLLELCLIRKKNNQKLKQPCFVYHVYIDVGNKKD